MAKKTYIIYAEAKGVLMAHVEAESPEEGAKQATTDFRWMPVSLSAGEILSAITEDEESDVSGVHDLSKWFQE